MTTHEHIIRNGEREMRINLSKHKLVMLVDNSWVTTTVLSTMVYLVEDIVWHPDDIARVYLDKASFIEFLDVTISAVPIEILYAELKIAYEKECQISDIMIETHLKLCGPNAVIINESATTRHHVFVPTCYRNSPVVEYSDLMKIKEHANIYNVIYGNIKIDTLFDVPPETVGVIPCYCVTLSYYSTPELLNIIHLFTLLKKIMINQSGLVDLECEAALKVLATNYEVEYKN